MQLPRFLLSVTIVQSSSGGRYYILNSEVCNSTLDIFQFFKYEIKYMWKQMAFYTKNAIISDRLYLKVQNPTPKLTI